MIENAELAPQVLIEALLAHESTEHGLDQLWVGRESDPYASGYAQSAFALRAAAYRKKAKADLAKGVITREKYDAMMKRARHVEQYGWEIVKKIQLIYRVDAVPPGKDDVTQKIRDMVCETFSAIYFKASDAERQKTILQAYRAMGAIQGSSILLNKASYYGRMIAEPWSEDPITKLLRGDEDAFEAVTNYFNRNTAMGWSYEIEQAILDGQVDKAEHILKQKKKTSDEEKAKGEQREINDKDFREYRGLIKLAKRNLTRARLEIRERRRDLELGLFYIVSAYSERNKKLWAITSFPFWIKSST
jgi:hypothetical protein